MDKHRCPCQQMVPQINQFAFGDLEDNLDTKLPEMSFVGQSQEPTLIGDNTVEKGFNNGIDGGC